MKRLVGIVLIATVGGLASLRAQPESAKVSRWAPAVTKSFDDGVGSNACQRCHEKKDSLDDRAYDLIHRTPFETWNGPDPHRHAYSRLSEDNPLAKQMNIRLSDEVTGFKFVGQRQPECLVCHAVDREVGNKIAEKKSFRYDTGISCEACHGNADEWNGEHQKNSWRTLHPTAAMAPAKSKSSFGFIDLRDPARRAAQCVGCHVGNLDQGKFVTHEMYAAGHPPLLPFEAVTFLSDQPAHRLDPKSRKYLNELDADKAEKLFHHHKDEVWQARDMMEGAAVSLAATARLLESAAATAVKDKTMLDYAHFDCFACHHELVTPSLQIAESDGITRPGRPGMRPLPTELVRAGLDFAKRPDAITALDQLVADLKREFTDRPFGDASKINVAAGKLRALAEQHGKVFHGLGYMTADAERLKQSVFKKTTVSRYPNRLSYDSAQQLAWAARHLGADKDANLYRSMLYEAGLKADESAEKLLDRRLEKRYGFNRATFWLDLAPPR